MVDITLQRSDKSLRSGKKLKTKRFGTIHKFLLEQYENQDLLKGLYQIACGERFLFTKDAETLLQAKNIMKSDGEIDDEVKDVILESIIIKPDGSVNLEINH